MVGRLAAARREHLDDVRLKKLHESESGEERGGRILVRHITLVPHAVGHRAVLVVVVDDAAPRVGAVEVLNRGTTLTVAHLGAHHEDALGHARQRERARALAEALCLLQLEREQLAPDRLGDDRE